MATGPEILQYRGDAALASGSDATNVAALGGIGKDALSGVNDALDKAMQHQLVWNTMKYKQAIQDRDDTFNLFASQNVEFPVLDDDRPVLQKKIDEIKNDLIATPNIKADRNAYLKVQGKINELTALKASAKTRYATGTALKLAAQNEVNPIKKERMLSSLNEQIGKGVEHQIDPYNQLVEWDRNSFAKPSTVTTFEYSVDEKGIPYKTPITRPLISDYTKHYSFEGVVSGGKANLPFEIKSFYEQQVNNPDIMNPDTISKLNAKIDAFNAVNNLTPDSADWARHIADVDDGRVVPNSNPTQFMRSFDIAANYAVSRGAKVIDEDKLKGMKTLSETNENNAQAKAAITNAAASMKRADTDASLAPAQIEKYKAEAGKARADGDNTRYETAILKGQASEQLNNVVQLFGNESRADGYKPLAGTFASPEVAAPKLQQEGIGSDWTFRDLGKKNEVALRALTQGAFDKDEKLITETPLRILMARSPDGDVNKDRLVGIRKDGSIYGVLDGTQTVERMLLNQSGYKKDKSFQDKSSVLPVIYRDMQGGDQIGLDIGVILNRKNVVDNTTNGTTTNKTLELGGKQYIRQGDNVIDPETGKIVLKVNGAGEYQNVE